MSPFRKTNRSGEVAPVGPGDRFESKDSRDRGRVVEVVELAGTYPLTGERRWRVRTEAHPLNPYAVGNVSNVSESGLLGRYRRISR